MIPARGSFFMWDSLFVICSFDFLYSPLANRVATRHSRGDKARFVVNERRNGYGALDIRLVMWLIKVHTVRVLGE
jgi:hypothetical protein